MLEIHILTEESETWSMFNDVTQCLR